MIRRHDWLERLQAFLADPTNAIFEWGRNDCVLFAANCAKELVDLDLVAGINVSWTDEPSAEKALEAYGGLYAATVMILGEPMDNPRMAHRGDVALTTIRDRKFLAIHMGDRLVAPSREGLVNVSIQYATHVWITGR